MAFHNLRALQTLEIKCCPNLISLSFEGFSELISLELLEISDCPSLLMSHLMPEELAQDNTKYLLLPSLKHLRISSCGITGKRLLQLLSHLQPLEEMKILNCPRITSLVVDQLTNEGSSVSPSLMLDEGLLQVPSRLFVSLKELEITWCLELHFQLLADVSSLVKLTVSDSPSLRSLLLHSFTSLEELEIAACELLASPEGLQFLDRLRVLHISKCPIFLETWNLTLQERADESCLLPPSLQQLWLTHLPDKLQSRLLGNLPSLSKLDMLDSPRLASLQLRSCTALEMLTILRCESLAALEGLQFLSHLRVLRVSDCPGFPEAWNLALQEQERRGLQLCCPLEQLYSDDSSILAIAICKHLTSHRCLILGDLFGFEDADRVVSLTENQEEALQLLTSLQELEFHRCNNLRSLPAGLHSLPSVMAIEIRHCPAISRLPEKGLPPSLQYLHVKGCSDDLNEQCRKTASSRLKVKIDSEDIN